MSEAEKKQTGGDSTAASGSGERGGNVKPFPDFIVPPPAGVSASGGAASGASASGASGQGTGGAQAASTATTVHPRVSSSPPGKPPRARGGGWAFLFALTSLAAAGVSLSAPSLRPIAAEKLKQQFGDQYWIGVVTGTVDTRPPSVVQLDLQQFDARLQALANTLTTANPGAPVDGATLARFADAAGATQRMAEFETALNQLKAGENENLALLSQAVGKVESSVAEFTQRLEGAENAVNALGEQFKTAEGQAARAVSIAETADTAAKELATSLGGVMRKLETVETGLAELSGKLTELDADVGRRVSEALVPVGARQDAAEKQASDNAAAAAAAVETVRNETAAAAGNIAGVAEDLQATQAVAATQDGRLNAVAAEAQALAGGVAALNKQLAALEQTVAQQQGAAAAAVLGLSNRLRVAVDEGEVFAVELKALTTLVGGDAAFAPSVAALAPLADHGAPSLAYLRREFNVVARKIVEAEDAAQPAWYARQWSNVQYYMGWGAGAAAGAANGAEGSRAALSQAAGAINAGQFAEAIAAMATLNPAAAEQAQAWLTAARARVAADQAVRNVNALALARLGR